VTAPPPDDDGAPKSNRANIAAIVAIVVLAGLAYWAFSAIDHMRKVQRCLDEGRRDCLQVQQGK